MVTSAIGNSRRPERRSSPRPGPGQFLHEQLDRRGKLGGTAPTGGVQSYLFFDGSTRTSAVNDFAANTTFGALTFNAGAAPFTLTGNAIDLSGDVVNNSPNLQTVNVPLALQTNVNLGATSGNLSIGGAISGAFGITVPGPGTVTLAGTNTYTGATTLRNGTLIVTGSMSGSTLLDIGGSLGSTLVVNGGSISVNGAARLGWTTGTNTVTAATIYLASGSMSAAADSNVGFNDLAGGSATSTMYQAGGTYTQSAGNFYIGVITSPGAVGSASGAYDISGGSLTVATGQLIIATTNIAGAVGTLNVNGGTVTTPNVVTNNGTVGVPTVFLGTGPNGSGTLTASTWTTAGTNLNLGFSGGTLRAGASSAAYLGAFDRPDEYLRGGAKIDTQANSITIGQSFQNPGRHGDHVRSASPTSTDVFQTPTAVVFTGGTGSGGSGYTVLDANGHVTGVVVTNPGTYSIVPIGITIAGADPGNVSTPTFTSAANSLGGLTKVGSGHVAATGANSYAGVTKVTAGTLEFAIPASLYNGVTASWTPANIVVPGGSTLALNYGGATISPPQTSTTLLANLTTVNNNGLEAGSTFALDTTNGNASLATPITDSTGSGGGAIRFRSSARTP